IMLAKLLIITGLVCTVVATPRVPSIVQRNGFQPINPPDSALLSISGNPPPSRLSSHPLHPPPSTPSAQVHPTPLSFFPDANAERLAAGLSPLPPARSRTTNPRSLAVPSNTPSVVQGYIQLTETGTGADYGYVSKNLNSDGEFGTTTDLDQRLIVSINLGDIEEGQFNIVVNGASPHIYFGGIVGYSSTSSDLQSGSYNYAFLGQTEASQPNSPAVSMGNSFNDATGLSRGVESAIWTYDVVSGTFSPRWVNNDHSFPTTYIGFA
ncbi:hypothetical protein K443DRAFT_100635, partial [Laccaria amethystina LaAM-08-1]